MPSRIRNRLIFLACLFAFAGVGVVIYREWVVQKPFAVILFVAENFAPSQLSSARLFTGGGDFRFRMESMPHLALATARAADFAVADSAAAASAIATGHRVNRGALALSPEGHPLDTLLSVARRSGRAIGLVSNTPLTDAAMAAFFARATDARDPSSIALQLMEENTPDVLLAGGGRHLIPEAQGGARRDGRDLLLEMRQRGFDIVRTTAELESTPGWRAPRTFGVFAEDDFAFADEQTRYPTQPRLADLVRRAIQLLQFNRKGYFLVIHDGLAGRAAQQGRGEALLRQYAELDAAIGTALDYAGGNALIIVTGLANTGGLRLNAFSFAPDRGIAVLGPSASGIPALTWSTGPAASVADAGSAPPQAVAAPTERPQPVAEDILILATGPGSEKLPNFPDLTTLHQILAEGL